ncbi:Insect cuticle protein [Trinorchestia longiramus]|nr:Insect cuticle protein [Trinorchestia longiramus]
MPAIAGHIGTSERVTGVASSRQCAAQTHSSVFITFIIIIIIIDEGSDKAKNKASSVCGSILQRQELKGRRERAWSASGGNRRAGDAVYIPQFQVITASVTSCIPHTQHKPSSSNMFRALAIALVAATAVMADYGGGGHHGGLIGGHGGGGFGGIHGGGFGHGGAHAINNIHGGHGGAFGHGGGGYGQGHYAPAYYGFEYGVHDPYYGANFGHKEQRDGHKTKGSYYVNLPDGRLQKVSYTADEYGYRPVVTYEGIAKFPVIKKGYH